MSTPTTILVGVDYSDTSIAALDQALLTARGLEKARLVAVLVLSPQPVGGFAEFSEPTAELLKISQGTLEELVRSRTAQLVPDVAIETKAVVCLGDVAGQLVANAELHKADLVVVGTHSRKGFGRFVLGSVAESVVRTAPCSVLVAKPHSPPKEQADDTQSFEQASLELADEDAHTAGTSNDVILISGPHLDGGRVVATLVDDRSGRMFLCVFEAPGKVSVGPLEGPWGPRPSADQKVRVGREGLRLMVEDSSTFEGLFAEAARRAREAD